MARLRLQGVAEVLSGAVEALAAGRGLDVQGYGAEVAAALEAGGRRRVGGVLEVGGGADRTGERALWWSLSTVTTWTDALRVDRTGDDRR